MSNLNAKAGQISSEPKVNYPILLLFTLSGIAALIYQVCWQRSLFSILGVDLESTTIVVSVFMLGLGCGSILGGIFADAYPEKRLLAFAVAEIATGLYGFASPRIISFVASSSGLGFGHTGNLIKSFCVLILPTTLMGATLPILVSHIFSTEKNIGTSVGKLYFANTIGGAIGAGVATFYLFMIMGISDATKLAAAINAGVAVATYAIFSTRRA